MHFESKGVGWRLTDEAGLELPNPSKGDRSLSSFLVDLDAGSQPEGATGPVWVRVLYLSAQGFHIKTRVGLKVGSDVWLRVSGLVYQAEVVWTKDHLFGCAFTRPIHPPVLEMAVGYRRC